MKKMILVSLGTNILVLIPVCTTLVLAGPHVAEVFGMASPARGILLSIYLAILAVSVWLLFDRRPMLVAPLLLVQVIYKFTTPVTVGKVAHPVVISNLLIAAVHAITLALIWRELRALPGDSEPVA